jgi:hypothetical protein
MHSARFAFRFLFAAGFALVGAACNSHSDNVCQNIGNCSYGGSDDFITACQDEAKALRSEASGSGCGPAFDAYYACADSNYSCRGATAVFPGCDGDLAALDSCLAAATTDTSCAALTAAQVACGSATAPDAGASTAGDAGAGNGPPPACTAARDCQARCFLDSVANVCAPRVDEIEAVTTCAFSCPP